MTFHAIERPVDDRFVALSHLLAAVERVAEACASATTDERINTAFSLHLADVRADGDAVVGTAKAALWIVPGAGDSVLNVLGWAARGAGYAGARIGSAEANPEAEPAAAFALAVEIELARVRRRVADGLAGAA